MVAVSPWAAACLRSRVSVGGGDGLVFGAGAGVKAFFEVFEDAGAAGEALVLVFGVQEFGDEFEVHGVVGAEFNQQAPFVGAEMAGLGSGGKGVGEDLAGDLAVDAGQGVVKFVLFFAPDAADFDQLFLAD